MVLVERIGQGCFPCSTPELPPGEQLGGLESNQRPRRYNRSSPWSCCDKVMGRGESWPGLPFSGPVGIEPTVGLRPPVRKQDLTFWLRRNPEPCCREKDCGKESTERIDQRRCGTSRIRTCDCRHDDDRFIRLSYSKKLWILLLRKWERGESRQADIPCGIGWI